MRLDQVFELVRPSVVAFSPRVLPATKPQPPQLFPIIGTGFIVGDGLVLTNDHVVDALLRLPRPPEWPKEQFPFTAILSCLVKKKDYPNLPIDGFVRVGLEVLGLFKVGEVEMKDSGFYYGPRKPDFSVVHVKCKGLPKLELLPDTSLLRAGTEVGTIGYPMGTDALASPGWVHQLVPFLQRGIISAVLPFPCEAPHSFVINLMSMGGASGSPVFLSDDPRPIGILNAGLTDLNPTFVTDGNNTFQGVTRSSTNFSYVVPSFLFAAAIETIVKEAHFTLPPDTKSLDELLREGKPQMMKEPGHNEPPSQPSVVQAGAPQVRVDVRSAQVEDKNTVGG